MKKIAIFPGSFDPFTIGHASIVRRGIPLFDELIIGIGVNESKRTLFTLEERLRDIHMIYANHPSIKVEEYNDLTVDFAQRMHANYILRGLRSVKDFEYERDIASMNQRITGIETVLLFTEPEYTSISSSVVRELISYDKDVSAFLPSNNNQ